MNRSIRHCRCGSTTHLRTSHYECPLNQNKQPTAHNSSVNLCRCGSDTHSRTTHYDCPLNRSTRRRYEDCQVHQGSHQLHGDSNQRVSSSLICSRCGRRGHSSAHNRSCPFNKLNIINERLGAQYNQAASSISFVPESVFGSYVRDDQGPNYHRHLLPPFETICSTSGALMCIEERLQSATSTRLQFSLCCSNGKINLPLPTPPPEEMLSMLLGDRTTNETIADFHTNIRSYNTLFAFASTVANVDQSLLWQGSNRPTTFRINGTIYHCIGALRSNNYQQSNFSQIYFHDAFEQLQRRTNLISHLKPETVQLLQKIIHDNNHYAIKFMTAVDQDRDEPIGNLQVVISGAKELGRRQFPVRPAFAMTIHKSQGQSLDYVGVYLKDQVFAHGQLYVALSRSRDPSNLRVATPQPFRNSQPQTANIVYRDVLL